MADLRLAVNDRIIINDVEYLILYLQNDQAVVIQLNTSKLSINYLPTEFLKKGLADGSIQNAGPRPGFVITIDDLPEAAQKRYYKYSAMIREVEAVYAPVFIDLCGKGSKPEVCAIMEKFQVSPKTFWKVVREYLQSGRDSASLIGYRYRNADRSRKKHSYKAKPGRKGYSEVEQSGVCLNDEVEKHFAKALEDYKKGRQTTLSGAYQDMRNTYYMRQVQTNDGIDWEYLPESEIPTYRQFYYYCQKHISKEEKEVLKTSAAEVRNNKRLLMSDAMKGVHGPGDMVEIDAMETDVSLVSMRDRERTIGRAILYCMIDVFSRAIIAISVSFENNSIKGMTNLLLNLCDDKVEYAAKYGITLDPSLWPSNIIPRRARVDRGAEFRSDRLSAIFREIGIERNLVSPASGSMKGIVEQEFRQMQFNQNALLEKSGLIEKRYDSRHHREARLTINEFTALCINFVASHNQKYLQYYRPNRRMLDAKVPLVPVRLWAYGCIEYGSPRPIANRESFLWSLLTPATATLSRKGAAFEGHHYFNLEDKDLTHEMFNLGNRTQKMEIRYDPRDLGSIYYLKDNRLLTLRLGQDKFENDGFEVMGHTDRRDYLQAERTAKAQGRRHNAKVNGIERLANKSVIDSVKSPRYAESSEMRVSRSEEKALVNQENAIKTRLDAPEPTADKAAVLPAAEPEKADYDDFNEAIDNFFDSEYDD